ncbi:hypothetical protein GQ53DRAFT_809677 [Thozetella sp. PMI_491]|nr:hypothetical protein GQ53DRAFT_809677 [Thozetella sp. PMI_491]
MAIVSEVLRFILPRSPASTAAFADLRRRVAARGAVTTQFFGYVLPDEGMPRPKPAGQMCWYIEWPEQAAYRASGDFQAALAKMSEGTARSLRFEFAETKEGEIRKGLESAVCQFAIINAKADAPRFQPEFEASMHKTYTDTYGAAGFTGGGWGYALNSNDADGAEVGEAESSLLEGKDRRLAYYILGWNTLQDHHAYAQTDLFFEEINNLAPYFGSGSGAFYAQLEAH